MGIRITEERKKEIEIEKKYMEQFNRIETILIEKSKELKTTLEMINTLKDILQTGSEKIILEAPAETYLAELIDLKEKVKEISLSLSEKLEKQKEEFFQILDGLTVTEKAALCRFYVYNKPMPRTGRIDLIRKMIERNEEK